MSCYTSKKADTDLNKIQDKFPEKIATFARDKYPLITKIDTVTDLQEVTVYVDCPEVVADRDRIDSFVVYENKIKTVRVPVKIPAQTITITKTVEDSAKITLLNLDKALLNLTISDLTKSVNSQRSWKKAAWITAGVFFLISLGLVIFIFNLYKKQAK
jgi:hypothetical protein